MCTVINTRSGPIIRNISKFRLYSNFHLLSKHLKAAHHEQHIGNLNIDYQQPAVRHIQPSINEMFRNTARLQHTDVTNKKTVVLKEENGVVKDKIDTNVLLDPPVGPPLSLRDKLKKAVAEYGSTVIIFHVTISLVSLGTCYLLVSRYL